MMLYLKFRIRSTNKITEISNLNDIIIFKDNKKKMK